MSVPLPWAQLPRTAVIVGMEMAAGDACEQQIAGAGAWDKGRSARLGVTGLVTTGPLAHALFRQLEIISPGTSSRAVFSKVLMNAAFMPVMISATLSTAWILEGRRRTEIFTLLKRELGAAVLGGLAFWPAANLVVYKLVRPGLRPIVSSGFGGVWGVFLAAKAASANHVGSKT